MDVDPVVSDSKGVPVNILPLAEKRIYRYNDDGSVIFEDQPTPDQRLKLLAQLLHEPVSPEVDLLRTKVDQSLRQATVSWNDLRAISALIGQDQELRLHPADPPPQKPETLQNSLISQVQGRINQLRRSTSILQKAAQNNRKVIEQERQYHHDIETLIRTRWQLLPEHESRSQNWTTPRTYHFNRVLATGKQHINIHRDDDSGQVAAQYIPPQSMVAPVCEVIPYHYAHSTTNIQSNQENKTQLGIQKYSHHINIPQAIYPRLEMHDLYRPNSNSFYAIGLFNVHRLLCYLSRVTEDWSFWNFLESRALLEGVEVKNHKILFNYPHNMITVSISACPVRRFPIKSFIHRINLEDFASKSPSDIIQNSEDDVKTDIEVDNSNLKKRKIVDIESNFQTISACSVSLLPNDTHSDQFSTKRNPRYSDHMDTYDSISINVVPLSDTNSKQPIGVLDSRASEITDEAKTQTGSNEKSTSGSSLSYHPNLNQFETFILQNLVMVALRQIFSITQNGSYLDQSKTSIYPQREYNKLIHKVFEPTKNLILQWNQVYHISRLLDDWTRQLRISKIATVITHWMSCENALSVDCHIKIFGNTIFSFSVKEGRFELHQNSELIFLDHYIPTFLHITKFIQSYIFSRARQLVLALQGPLVQLPKVSPLNRVLIFPYGIIHPLLKLNEIQSTENPQITKPEKSKKKIEKQDTDTYYWRFEILWDSPNQQLNTVNVEELMLYGYHHVPYLYLERVSNDDISIKSDGRNAMNETSAVKYPLNVNLYSKIAGNNFLEKLTQILLFEKANS